MTPEFGTLATGSIRHDLHELLGSFVDEQFSFEDFAARGREKGFLVPDLEDRLAQLQGRHQHVVLPRGPELLGGASHPGVW